jgi:hypothetical protein
MMISHLWFNIDVDKMDLFTVIQLFWKINLKNTVHR